MRSFLLKCPKCGSTETENRDKIIFKCLKCGHVWKHKEE